MSLAPTSDQFRKQQQEQIEALQSIFIEQFQIIQQIPFEFQVILKPPSVQSSQQLSSVILGVLFPQTYPNAKPQILFKNPINIENNDLILLEDIANDIISQNQNNTIIFDIIEALREKLDQLNNMAMMKKQQEKERQVQERKKNLQMGQKEKFIVSKDTLNYTPVTPQNFKIWYDKFIKVVNLEKELKRKKEELQYKNRVTGRQWFEIKKEKQKEEASFKKGKQQDSDQEEEEMLEKQAEELQGVEIDPSLYEDIEDFDIE